MMKDLEEGVVDWLSDTEFEEPEMNPKYDYDSYALTDIPVSDHSQCFPTSFCNQSKILSGNLGTSTNLAGPWNNQVIDQAYPGLH